MTDTGASPSKSKWKFNPWPIGITGWIGGFILLCVYFVIRALSLNHDLVEPDYFKAGVDHDVKMRAVARTRALESPPSIELDTTQNRLIVRLPESANGAVLTMYRPNDAKMDLKYALQDQGVPSVLSTLDLHPGKWQAQIDWTTDGIPYYHEEDVYVP